MPRIGDIIEERATLVQEMREVLNTAESDSRDLTAEERQEYDRREARVQELEGDVRRHEQAQRAEELDIRVVTGDPETETEERATIDRSSDEYRDAFNAYARGQELDAEQRTTLNVGTDADGGFAVPEAWTALYEGLREFGLVRAEATVITTESGGTLHIPKVGADATLPVVTAEEAAIADDGETFAEVTLGAFKFARMTKASEEFVQDALFDVASFIGRRLGEDLALATGADYVNGDGTNEPEGLFTGATVADTLAANGALTADEVIDLRYSVTPPYRTNGVFILNDSTAAAIRKLKDSQGQYLWQPALTAGQPDLILGHRVIADPNVGELGAAVGTKVIGFGDVRRAFTIRDVLGVSVKFLDQRFADNDQVAWRGKLRSDSGVVDTDAFKVADLPI